jgi:hypothetical protein
LSIAAADKAGLRTRASTPPAHCARAAQPATHARRARACATSVNGSSSVAHATALRCRRRAVAPSWDAAARAASPARRFSTAALCCTVPHARVGGVCGGVCGDGALAAALRCRRRRRELLRTAALAALERAPAPGRSCAPTAAAMARCAVDAHLSGTARACHC